MEKQHRTNMAKQYCPYCKKGGFTDNSLFGHLMAGNNSCPDFLKEIDTRMAQAGETLDMELPVIRPLPPLPC
jgi:hypothetical protein